MTSFRLNPVLIVLQDAQQQTILDEIMKRRLEAMKKKLAQVDFNRPYYEEARKFNWLREEGVITEQEYRHARQKIAAMRGKAGSPPPGMGSMN
jgi:50S ribosomal subunit-associated GTPase HflX